MNSTPLQLRGEQPRQVKQICVRGGGPVLLPAPLPGVNEDGPLHILAEAQLPGHQLRLISRLTRTEDFRHDRLILCENPWVRISADCR